MTNVADPYTLSWAKRNISMDLVDNMTEDIQRVTTAIILKGSIQFRVPNL